MILVCARASSRFLLIASRNLAWVRSHHVVEPVECGFCEIQQACVFPAATMVVLCATRQAAPVATEPARTHHTDAIPPSVCAVDTSIAPRITM